MNWSQGHLKLEYLRMIHTNINKVIKGWGLFGIWRYELHHLWLYRQIFSVILRGKKRDDNLQSFGWEEQRIGKFIRNLWTLWHPYIHKMVRCRILFWFHSDDLWGLKQLETANLFNSFGQLPGAWGWSAPNSAWRKKRWAFRPPVRSRGMRRRLWIELGLRQRPTQTRCIKLKRNKLTPFNKIKLGKSEGWKKTWVWLGMMFTQSSGSLQALDDQRWLKPNGYKLVPSPCVPEKDQSRWT